MKRLLHFSPLQKKELFIWKHIQFVLIRFPFLRTITLALWVLTQNRKAYRAWQSDAALIRAWLKNTCLPFRLSTPHLFSLLADDSCSPRIQNWLGNLFCTQLRGGGGWKWKKRSDPSRQRGRTNIEGTPTGKIEKQMTASRSRKNLFKFQIVHQFPSWHPAHPAGITLQTLALLLEQGVHGEKLQNKPFPSPSPHWMLIYSLVHCALCEVILTINL